MKKYAEKMNRVELQVGTEKKTLGSKNLCRLHGINSDENQNRKKYANEMNKTLRDVTHSLYLRLRMYMHPMHNVLIFSLFIVERRSSWIGRWILDATRERDYVMETTNSSSNRKNLGSFFLIQNFDECVRLRIKWMFALLSEADA